MPMNCYGNLKATCYANLKATCVIIAVSAPCVASALRCLPVFCFTTTKRTYQRCSPCMCLRLHHASADEHAVLCPLATTGIYRHLSHHALLLLRACIDPSRRMRLELCKSTNCNTEIISFRFEMRRLECRVCCTRTSCVTFFWPLHSRAQQRPAAGCHRLPQPDKQPPTLCSPKEPSWFNQLVEMLSDTQAIELLSSPTCSTRSSLRMAPPAERCSVRRLLTGTTSMSERTPFRSEMHVTHVPTHTRTPEQSTSCPWN